MASGIYKPVPDNIGEHDSGELAGLRHKPISEELKVKKKTRVRLFRVRF